MTHVARTSASVQADRAPAATQAAPGPLSEQLARAPRSTAQRQRLQAAFGGTVQRKATFTGAGLEPGARLADVKPLARKALMTLGGRVDDNLFQAFVQALPASEADLGLGVQLIRLLHDPTDHGEFNLDNEQHVAMLFHAIMKEEVRGLAAFDLVNDLIKALRKHAAAVGIPRPDDDPVIKGLSSFSGLWLQDALFEIKVKPPGLDMRHVDKAVDLDLENPGQLKTIHQHLGGKFLALRQDAEQPANTPEGAPVWSRAYLGTGAAVAYHMVANRQGAKPNDTIVIGKQQPWKPYSPEDRAFSSVNHPMGWITPRRDTVDERESFADTGEFSEQIEQVIAAHSAMRVEVALDKGAVTKHATRPYYEIKTERGTYRARHVVSALGIGKHKSPIDDAKEFKRRQDTGENERVLDMDAFHRQLRDPQSALNGVRGERKDQFSVVLVGPNAGVDVAFSTTTQGIDTTWFAASGPAWVKGFANYGIKGGKLTVVLAYLEDYKPLFDTAKKALGVQAVPGKDRYEKPMAELLLKNGVREVLNAASAPKKTFDYLVHAAGPDTSASDALDKPLTDALNHPDAAIKDTDHRFSQPLADPKDTNVTKGRKGVADDLTLGAAHERNLLSALWRWFDPARGTAAQQRATDTLEKLRKILGHLDAVPELPFEAPLDARVVNKDGSSIEVIGAQSARLTSKVSNSMKAQSVVTLPPTVVGSDQLTPSRGRIEASANTVPAYLGKAKGGIDLATDDQLVIAAWVAMQHSLPPLLADYVTQRIIQERRGKADPKALLGIDPDTGIRPDMKEPGSFGKTFTDNWTKRLQQLEQACSR